MKRVFAAVIARITRVEHGQDLLEYGILMALIAIVAMAGVKTLGNQINALLWQTIVQNF
jgi:Flp pilus assembly pilin Flp